MRVKITIHPPCGGADEVREEAEWWLRNREMRDRWSVEENEDGEGRAVLIFEFMSSLDGMDFHHRTAPAEHRGRIL